MVISINPKKPLEHMGIENQKKILWRSKRQPHVFTILLLPILRPRLLLPIPLLPQSFG
jgi:hypothetical protein